MTRLASIRASQSLPQPRLAMPQVKVFIDEAEKLVPKDSNGAIALA